MCKYLHGYGEWKVNECTENLFLKDVAQHEMIVVRDDGMHRHIRFKRPDTYCMHFDLITWPGYLCYTGDMGTYVFRRLEDMFNFFRTDREHMHLREGRTLAINPSYWGEKLESIDRVDGFKEFSEERFNRAVVGDLVTWIRDHREGTTKEDRRALWDEVVSQVLGADGDHGGYRKQCAAHDFSYAVNRDVGKFYFRDFWEHSVEDYSFRFIWCCYALAWGVAKYDAAKTSVAQAA